jgi:Cu2+-exporting ATPase
MAITDVRGAAAALPRRAARACAHCGLEVPRGLEDRTGGPSFCCHGCAAAYGILRDAGLSDYHALPERRLAPVVPSGRSYDEFDHPAFGALHVRAAPGGLAEADFDLEGVHCVSCVWLVERMPRLVPGLARAELDAGRARVRVTWDPLSARLSAIARGLDALGYRPHPFRGARDEQRRRREERAMLGRIGVAGAIAANVMMIAFALYAGWFTGMDASLERYFRWWSLALTAPALLWPGFTFLRGAWVALRTRVLHMDVPIALALVAGFVRGAWNTVADRGPIYFDGVAGLVFLLLVGRFLQLRAQRSAADAASLLASLSPSTARIVENGVERVVPAEALLPGMTLALRPGETLAADGIVESGHSDLQAALLTGESRPVPAGPGDPVWAGTLNLATPLRVRVEKAGEGTRVAALARQVEEGARRRAPVVRAADRLAGVFVAIVLALAVLTFVLWAPRDPDRALDHAIALLVVTCPCALALATPLAVAAAIGRAARAGILVKSGEALERLARPGAILLDKTGTLTEGRIALVAWEGPAHVRPWVLALERHASHPAAAGFIEAWPAIPIPEAVSVAQTIGGGVQGRVGGHHVVVGSPAFVRDRARGAAPRAATADPTLTPVWVAVDGEVVACAGFGDPLREEAPGTLDALRALGFRPRLLSGDDPRVVGAIGARLGFAPAEIRGGATPEDKQNAVEEAVREGGVVMVGDGVNDAPAIARATVGVGMRGGAEACLAAADVFLARPGLGGLVALARGAARTMTLIRGLLAFALIYNLAAATLAMAGLVPPLVAAVLMPASSLAVIVATATARTFEEPPR